MKIKVFPKKRFKEKRIGRRNPSSRLRWKVAAVSLVVLSVGIWIGISQFDRTLGSRYTEAESLSLPMTWEEANPRPNDNSANVQVQNLGREYFASYRLDYEKRADELRMAIYPYEGVRDPNVVLVRQRALMKSVEPLFEQYALLLEADHIWVDIPYRKVAPQHEIYQGLQAVSIGYLEATRQNLHEGNLDLTISKLKAVNRLAEKLYSIPDWSSFLCADRIKWHAFWVAYEGLNLAPNRAEDFAGAITITSQRARCFGGSVRSQMLFWIDFLRTVPQKDVADFVVSDVHWPKGGVSSDAEGLPVAPLNRFLLNEALSDWLPVLMSLNSDGSPKDWDELQDALFAQEDSRQFSTFKLRSPPLAPMGCMAEVRTNQHTLPTLVAMLHTLGQWVESGQKPVKLPADEENGGRLRTIEIDGILAVFSSSDDNPGGAFRSYAMPPTLGGDGGGSGPYALIYPFARADEFGGKASKPVKPVEYRRRASPRFFIGPFGF